MPEVKQRGEQYSHINVRNSSSTRQPIGQKFRGQESERHKYIQEKLASFDSLTILADCTHFIHDEHYHIMES
ncbi:hypothetical protein TNIN_296131 [Trichonephila inaurata madagascariensis]|uniref:Uncharacterized protein n=1 Tax=Trichonephila inaurata madagascariensis TaxID=2747483 RepID=A0A8X6WUM9_9ARAC|nr:hypothetical protein TNIN_296131 [Trichonephila inaurata madagascariensis]